MSAAFKLGDGVADKYKLFRRANAASAALVLKVDKDEETVVLDEEYPDTTPEDLQDELSDSAPRWILWSVKIERDDGRVQFPLLLIFFSPESCNQRMKMLYSSNELDDFIWCSCTPFIAQALDITKVHPIKDLDDLTFDKLKEFHTSSVTR